MKARQAYIYSLSPILAGSPFGKDREKKRPPNPFIPPSTTAAKLPRTLFSDCLPLKKLIEVFFFFFLNPGDGLLMLSRVYSTTLCVCFDKKPFSTVPVDIQHLHGGVRADSLHPSQERLTSSVIPKLPRHETYISIHPKIWDEYIRRQCQTTTSTLWCCVRTHHGTACVRHVHGILTVHTKTTAGKDRLPRTVFVTSRCIR